MEHLACNVYHWGRGPADRLLAECLAPAVRALRAEGLMRRFWFQRFDARGPHLFVLAGAAPDRADELRDRLGARLEAWVAAHPSAEPLSDDALRTRHAECRGKQLCALDGEPGIAPNNTLAWTPHSPDGYPLGLTVDVAERDALWTLLSDLAEWTLGRLGGGAGTAVRWMADVEAELRRAHPGHEGYWPLHAATLLTGLDERLDRDAGAVLGALPRVVGARNAAAFAPAWRAAEDGEPAWEGLAPLLRIALADDGRTREARLRLLREINHSVLGQLGQPVAAHVPLVLYGWMHGVSPAVAAV
jgi:hypothetical protein